MKKKITSIGIVDIDSLRLAPVTAVLLRDMLQQSKNKNLHEINVEYAGYERTSQNISNSAKGYLQTKGFKNTDALDIYRIDKPWLMSKDLILTIDKYIKRDILYNYPIQGEQSLEPKTHILTEYVGINDKIRDPGTEGLYNIRDAYELIERCLEKLVAKI